MTDVSSHGTTDQGSAAVRKVCAGSFVSGADVGVSFCANVEGGVVIEL